MKDAMIRVVMPESTKAGPGPVYAEMMGRARPEGQKTLHDPSTFLIDRDGNTSGIALGPRDWDSTVAHAVIESLLK